VGKQKLDAMFHDILENILYFTPASAQLLRNNHTAFHFQLEFRQLLTEAHSLPLLPN